jgi:TatD DNase family protein
MREQSAGAARLVDAHCHIDLYDNPAGVVGEAEAAGVYTIAVTNAPSVFRHTAALVKDCRYVRAAVGLHPELVHSHGRQVEKVPPLLKETRYVGEIGLDYTTADQAVRRAQRDVLGKILTWCAEYKDKVLTLHSRRAAADTVEAVGPNYPGGVILHWFSGSAAELERAVGYGMYFSVNPAMVGSQKGQALISRMPVERVITETDGPFVKHGPQPAEPRHTESVIEGLAELWRASPGEVREAVFANFKRLLTSGGAGGRQAGAGG